MHTLIVDISQRKDSSNYFNWFYYVWKLPLQGLEICTSFFTFEILSDFKVGFTEMHNALKSLLTQVSELFF